MSSTRPADTVTLLGRKTLMKGYRHVEDVTVQFISPLTHALAPPMSREVVHYSAVGAVLLYHPETDTVILSREFRIGPYLRGESDPWLWECAGGMVDEGEAPDETAIREAFEETGCKVVALEPIGRFFPSAGSSDEIFHMYCGRIETVVSGGRYGLIEDGEEITTHAFPADEAIALLDNGYIQHMGTAMCLSWLARHKTELQQKWRA